MNLECQLEWCKPADGHQVVAGRIVTADSVETLYRDNLTRFMIDSIYDTGCREFLYTRKAEFGE